MKIIVDQTLCIGSASCVAIAPKTFQLNGNIAEVVDENADDKETQLSAAKSCPVNAIKIIDDDGKQLWPPED